MFVDNGIVIDSKSGATGAGRALAQNTHFPDCNEAFAPYKIASHRHTPEIEQTLGWLADKEVKVLFTPHLLPLNRGIVSTCYVSLDKEYTLDDIYNLYKDHPSFYGFYLTDETCDYWLQLERNSKTEFTRMLYKGQSEIIRSLDDSLYIAIAPAAWRADLPKNFGEALYNLIKNDVEGERPIIDHVMMQDCLGRENSIAVSNSVYDSFRSYLIECKKGVEKAGGVFMNDAETFDVGYRIKRYDELIRSLSLESSYTNSTLIFDLAHYFSSTGKGSFDNYNYFDNDYVNSRYAKYVATFLD